MSSAPSSKRFLTNFWLLLKVKKSKLVPLLEGLEKQINDGQNVAEIRKRFEAKTKALKKLESSIRKFEHHFNPRTHTPFISKQ